jgi:hypothetical protein
MHALVAGVPLAPVNPNACGFPRQRMVNRKKRFTFMIEPELLDRLRAIKDRTGMTDSEQIRQAIRNWLETREWPIRRADKRTH